jgi:hypothetical protein
MRSIPISGPLLNKREAKGIFCAGTPFFKKNSVVLCDSFRIPEGTDVAISSDYVSLSV